ncbi:MAG: Na+/H+ antiporter subunit E [Myxococcota bacterium]
MDETQTAGERRRVPGEDRDRPPSALPGVLGAAVFLMLIWLGFSEKLDAFHLACGAASALFVSWLTHGLMVTGVTRTRSGRPALAYIWSFRWHRLIVFIPWLLWKIAVANIQVSWMVLHPRLPIEPSVIVLDTGLRTDIARLALSATITLTPGTCVLDVQGDRFVVHALHPASKGDLVSGRMVERVRETFELPSFEPLEAGEAGRV